MNTIDRTYFVSPTVSGEEAYDLEEISSFLSLVSNTQSPHEMGYHKKIDLLSQEALKAYFETARPDTFVTCPCVLHEHDSLRSDWDGIVDMIQQPTYRNRPVGGILEKYASQVENYKRGRRRLIFGTENALRMVVGHNLRCDIVGLIYKRVREGAGLEVVSESLKDTLIRAGTDMNKGHLVAVLEPLLAYYGMRLADPDVMINPYWSFELGPWATLLQFGTSAFGYDFTRIPQTMVCELEDEIIDDLMQRKFANYIALPPRVMPSKEFEIALRKEGVNQFQLELFGVFDEFNLEIMLYQWYCHYSLKP